MPTIDEIYQAHKNAVFRLALFYLNNAADAEDVTQTVFLKYILHRRRLSVGKEKSWLLRVAYHECVEWFRQKKHFTDAPVPELVVYDPLDGELREALLGLGEEERVAVYLYYYEGYSTLEIAKLLRVSRTCVTTRLYRARERLRKILEEEENESKAIARCD